MGNTCCLGREKPPAPPAALAESEASKGCTRRLLCPTLCGGRAHAGPATTRPHAGRGVVAAARPAAAEASAFSWPFLWANQVLQQFRGWAPKRKLVEAATARPGSTTGQWIRWPGTQLCTWGENSSGSFFLLARGSAEQGQGDDTRGHGQRLRHEGPTHHTFHARLMSCISLCIGRLAARPASLLGASRQRDNREETSESGLPAAMRAV